MSQSVTRLRHDEQMALYMQVATQALRAYAFEHDVVRIEPVSCINNVTFKVHVNPAGGAITHFALRMHRPGEADEARIRSELQWLMALQQDTQRFRWVVLRSVRSERARGSDLKRRDVGV